MLALSKPCMTVAGRPALAASKGRPASALPAHRRAGIVLPARRLTVRTASQKDEGDKGFKSNPVVPAFTRRREHVLGRVAALGFGFSLIGELLSGVGPIGQLHYETGISYGWIALIMAGLGAYGIVGGALSNATYSPSNQRDLAKRAPPPSLFQEPRRWLAYNEIYVGRAAMLGFASACALEYMYGGEAPLAHLNLITPGTQLSDAPLWLLVPIGLFLANGLGLFTAVGKEDERNF